MRLAVLGLALLLAAPAGAAKSLAVLGLRSGARQAGSSRPIPRCSLEEEPYTDPRIGDTYRYLYGGLATLSIEGTALVQRGPLQASLQERSRAIARCIERRRACSSRA